MALDPRQLKAFLAVARAGSLGRAAEALHVTQPALSRVIARLEAQLDVPLFERRTTGMELTSYGQALLPHATVLSEEAAVAIEQINSLRGLGQGSIRIGAVASAATMLLPSVLEWVLSRWPNLHVQITEAVEDVLEVALTNNMLDVVIAGPIAESDDIVQIGEHRFMDCYAVISATHHRLQSRGALTVQDLVDVPWVMPPVEAEPRRLFNALVNKLGIGPLRIAVETRSPSVIKAMVAKLGYLGWLPEPLFAAEQAAGLIRPLPVKELAVQRRFFVYRRRRQITPLPVQKFLEALRTLQD
jgi:DNA-binding transcriptional LysR family regulator